MDMDLTPFRTSMVSLTQELINTKPTVVIPNNTVFDTGINVGNLKKMGYRMLFGQLPNSSTRVVTIPVAVRNRFGQVGNYWIDTSNSFAYNATTGETLILPHSSTQTLSAFNQTNWQGHTLLSDQIVLSMNSNQVRIQTQSNRSAFQAIVTILFLEAQ